LRSKIEKDFDEPLLHTVRGAGYMLKAGSPAAKAKTADGQ
jgi:two-component system OmpR family response regulator